MLIDGFHCYRFILVVQNNPPKLSLLTCDPPSLIEIVMILQLEILQTKVEPFVLPRRTAFISETLPSVPSQPSAKALDLSLDRFEIGMEDTSRK